VRRGSWRSLAQWMALTPHELVEAHLRILTANCSTEYLNKRKRSCARRSGLRGGGLLSLVRASFQAWLVSGQAQTALRSTRRALRRSRTSSPGIKACDGSKPIASAQCHCPPGAIWHLKAAHIAPRPSPALWLGLTAANSSGLGRLLAETLSTEGGAHDQGTPHCCATRIPARFCQSRHSPGQTGRSLRQRRFLPASKARSAVRAPADHATRSA
jgi:hypothetical protein